MKKSLTRKTFVLIFIMVAEKWVKISVIIASGFHRSVVVKHEHGFDNICKLPLLVVLLLNHLYGYVNLFLI